MVESFLVSALFDKSIEGRETQAAEFLAGLGFVLSMAVTLNRLWRYCVSAITKMRRFRGNLRPGRVECEGARYADPWINLQAKNQNQIFQSESLILAQNERWRQA
jgi:hypothetical protein